MAKMKRFVTSLERDIEEPGNITFRVGGCAAMAYFIMVFI
jgi:hypothetical protein